MKAMTHDEQKISAVVITAGTRESHIMLATLASVAWADEVILIDKKVPEHPVDYFSNHDSAEKRNIKYVPAPWSPTVEPTRAFAVEQCTHPWIIMLDDDEILSPECEEEFRLFTRPSLVQRDVLAIPIKHYILGRHDPRAAYWPEYRPCFFRRGTVEYGSTVHSGTRVLGNVVSAPKDGPCFITHLSHESVSVWIEKTNRYTDQKDRSGQGVPPGDIGSWAIQRLATHLNAGGVWSDPYLSVNAVLHGIYEIIDGLKRWEETQLDGVEEFRRIATEVIERATRTPR